MRAGLLPILVKEELGRERSGRGGVEVSAYPAGRPGEDLILTWLADVREDPTPTRKATGLSKAENFVMFHENEVRYDAAASQMEVWLSLTDHQSYFGGLGMLVITRGQASPTSNPPRVKHTAILTY